MSFFFDVWTSEGFVLASDIRLIVNGESKYAHKIAISSPQSKVKCAIAVCGEYPSNSLGYFTVATLSKDSLREVAQRFATQWVERYAGTEDYSAIHLVGFENTGIANRFLPQMWFWSNWDGERYYSREILEEQLRSFANPIPHNNHIPQKIKQLNGSLPNPEQEYSSVMSFLQYYEPYFTWNGDTSFWRSAVQAIGSALNLLRGKKRNWTLDEVSRVTGLCLEFLVKLGNILPNSTVGLTDEGDFDVVSVTPQDAMWIKTAKFEE
jgi:hypothetical protein